ncbi:MAG: metallophosphoesterase [Candidatus Ranarchaeia archaeon]
MYEKIKPIFFILFIWFVFFSLYTFPEQKYVTDSDQSLKIGILGDTQILVTDNGSYFFQQMNYFIENNYDYIFCVGDIVNDSSSIHQWEIAKSGYKLLKKAGIPFGVVGGNHDYNTTDYSNIFEKYFTIDFMSNDKITSNFYNNTIHSHYDLVEKNEIKLLFLFLRYRPTNDTVEWASEVINNHTNYQVILVTHELYDQNDWYPRVYYSNLIDMLSNKTNILLTVNGHSAYCFHHFRNNTFNSMAINYQHFKKENHYIGLMKIKNQTMTFITYNPHLDDYIYSNSFCENITLYNRIVEYGSKEWNNRYNPQIENWSIKINDLFHQ